MLKRDWALALAPKELSGRPEGFIFACLCMAVVVLVAIADVRTHQYGTVGGIAFIPVLAAAWLLSDRMTEDGTAWTDVKILLKARKSQR